MKHLYLVAIAALMLLSACSSSHRPTYSGHEESTDGVPGFVNGKKVSPHVKLGQSYTVDGKTYVPRNQPDYVEEGMASWYGPGFHGGKTANGEQFSSDELTAAHRTLPLPSIVRVTMVSTGKQVYVRVNDRGPFAHSRIIDLSRAAADRIGLLRAGVAKVRIEYMKNESQRFADLLAQGRDPKSIDIASEVLNYQPTATEVSRYAQADMPAASEAQTSEEDAGVDANQPGFWNRVSPVRSANAAEPQNPSATQTAAPVSDVVSTDLPASLPPPRPGKPMKTAPAKIANHAAPVVPVASSRSQIVAAEQPSPALDPQDSDSSPFAVLDSSAGSSQSEEMEVASLEPNQEPSPHPSDPPTAAVASTGRIYVQLGAFQSETNAERLRKQYGQISGLQITPKRNDSGMTLYHVRMGPYSSVEASNKALSSAKQAGADAKIVRE